VRRGDELPEIVLRHPVGQRFPRSFIRLQRNRRSELHQLELVRRLQARHEVLQGDRAHLLDLLKTLWSLVRAEADTSSRDSATSERLIAICAVIREELDPATFPPGPRAFAPMLH